jgi:hypothetical protein
VINIERATRTFSAYADNETGLLHADAFKNALNSIDPSAGGKLDEAAFGKAASALGLSEHQGDEAFGAFGGNEENSVDADAIVAAASSTAGSDGQWDFNEFRSFLQPAEAYPGFEASASTLSPGNQSGAGLPFESNIFAKAATNGSSGGSAFGASGISYGLGLGPAANYVVELLNRNNPLAGPPGTFWMLSPTGSLLDNNNSLIVASTSPGRVAPDTVAAMGRLGFAPAVLISYRQGDVLDGNLSNPATSLGVIKSFNRNDLRLPNFINRAPLPLNMGLMSISAGNDTKLTASFWQDVFSGSSNISGKFNVVVNTSLNLTGAAAVAAASIPGGAMLGLDLQLSQQAASLQVGLNWKVTANFSNGQFTGFTKDGEPFDPLGTLGKILTDSGIGGEHVLPQNPVFDLNRGVLPGGMLPGEPGIPVEPPIAVHKTPDGTLQFSDGTMRLPNGTIRFQGNSDAHSEGGLGNSYTTDGVTHFFEPIPPGGQVPGEPGRASPGHHRGRLIAASYSPLPRTALVSLADAAHGNIGDIQVYRDGKIWNYYISPKRIESSKPSNGSWPLGVLSKNPSNDDLTQWAKDYNVPLSSIVVIQSSVNGQRYWDINTTQMPKYSM